VLQLQVKLKTNSGFSERNTVFVLILKHCFDVYVNGVVITEMENMIFMGFEYVSICRNIVTFLFVFVRVRLVVENNSVLYGCHPPDRNSVFYVTAYTMDANEAQEEYEEVQTELRKKEEEVSCHASSLVHYVQGVSKRNVTFS